MEDEISLQDIIALAESKIEHGFRLINELSAIDHVEGVKKVARKIKQEITTLKNKVNDQSIRVNHITCSNLMHFESLVKILLTCNGLSNVDYALPIQDRNGPLRIDAVCDHGATWIKVIARNTRSIEDAVHGRSSFGTKSILDQAEEYVEASIRHLHMFKPPKIYFVFSSVIGDDLVECLEEVGVNVCSLDEFPGIAKQSQCLQSIDFEQQLEGVETLNLDITTLLAYVSALSNPGEEHKGYYWQFKEPLLTEQSLWETRSPIKPLLDSIFANRKLIICETARQSFEGIVTLLGGEKERERTKQLLDRVQILPDVEEVGGSLTDIKVGGRIKPRSLKIFAFGLEHKAVTVTSNEGFIRAARMQGIDVPVFIHEARALTEDKEKAGERVPLLN